MSNFSTKLDNQDDALKQVQEACTFLKGILNFPTQSNLRIFQTKNGFLKIEDVIIPYPFTIYRGRGNLYSTKTIKDSEVLVKEFKVETGDLFTLRGYRFTKPMFGVFFGVLQFPSKVHLSFVNLLMQTKQYKNWTYKPFTISELPEQDDNLVSMGILYNWLLDYARTPIGSNKTDKKLFNKSETKVDNFSNNNNKNKFNLENKNNNNNNNKNSTTNRIENKPVLTKETSFKSLPVDNLFKGQTVILNPVVKVPTNLSFSSEEIEDAFGEENKLVDGNFSNLMDNVSSLKNDSDIKKETIGVDINKPIAINNYNNMFKVPDINAKTSNNNPLDTNENVKKDSWADLAEKSEIVDEMSKGSSETELKPKGKRTFIIDKKNNNNNNSNENKNQKGKGNKDTYQTDNKNNNNNSNKNASSNKNKVVRRGERGNRNDNERNNNRYKNNNKGRNDKNEQNFQPNENVEKNQYQDEEYDFSNEGDMQDQENKDYLDQPNRKDNSNDRNYQKQNNNYNNKNRNYNNKNYNNSNNNSNQNENYSNDDNNFDNNNDNNYRRRGYKKHEKDRVYKNITVFNGVNVLNLNLDNAALNETEKKDFGDIIDRIQGCTEDEQKTICRALNAVLDSKEFIYATSAKRKQLINKTIGKLLPNLIERSRVENPHFKIENIQKYTVEPNNLLVRGLSNYKSVERNNEQRNGISHNKFGNMRNKGRSDSILLRINNAFVDGEEAIPFRTIVSDILGKPRSLIALEKQIFRTIKKYSITFDEKVTNFKDVDIKTSKNLFITYGEQIKMRKDRRKYLTCLLEYHTLFEELGKTLAFKTSLKTMPIEVSLFSKNKLALFNQQVLEGFADKHLNKWEVAIHCNFNVLLERFLLIAKWMLYTLVTKYQVQKVGELMVLPPFNKNIYCTGIFTFLDMPDVLMLKKTFDYRLHEQANKKEYFPDKFNDCYVKDFQQLADRNIDVLVHRINKVLKVLNKGPLYPALNQETTKYHSQFKKIKLSYRAIKTMILKGKVYKFVLKTKPQDEKNKDEKYEDTENQAENKLPEEVNQGDVEYEQEHENVNEDENPSNENMEQPEGLFDEDD